MKYFGKFSESELPEITVSGWMKQYLEYQAEGITGNLDKCGYPFSQYGWYDFDTAVPIESRKITTDNCVDVDHNKLNWCIMEQTAYLLDGMQRCGALLNNKKLLDKAKRSFEFTLNHPDEEGWLGPQFMKKNDQYYTKWPYTVFLRALIAYYSQTGDEKILDAMKRHFFVPDINYTNDRDAYCIESALWLYGKTGDQELLKFAEELYTDYNKKARNDMRDEVALSPKKPRGHGVSYNEYSKLGAIMYMYTGNEKYLNASVNAYKKVDRYFMLASGLLCSEEGMISNYYMHSHEACDISDYTWSLGYMLMATGKGEYADKIEKCVYNAGIGSATEEFTSLQYFSCPNQLISDKKSNHNVFHRGLNWMQYRPNHQVQCCPGNITRFFPNFCARMWLKLPGGVASVFFGNSIFDTILDGNHIKIEEKTDYPFEDSVEYTVKKADKEFTLSLRIPAWSKGAGISVNGKAVTYKNKDGFANISVKAGDRICLELHPEISVNNYHGYGLVVERGPLVYSYGMYGRREVEPHPEFPAELPVLNIYPDKPWNYALITDDSRQYKFSKSEIKGNPWDIRSTPLKIKAKAKTVDNWKLNTVYSFRADRPCFTNPRMSIIKEKAVFTPKLPSKKLLEQSKNNPVCEIELVPLGCAKLRLTVFPRTDK